MGNWNSRFAYLKSRFRVSTSNNTKKPEGRVITSTASTITPVKKRKKNLHPPRRIAQDNISKNFMSTMADMHQTYVYPEFTRLQSATHPHYVEYFAYIRDL